MKKIAFITFLVALGIVLYGLTLRGVPGNPKGSDVKNGLDQATKPFELSPERGRFLLTMSLAENKSFALSQQLADAAYPDVGWHQGKYYIFFAPGISIFALPFYLIGKNYQLSQVASYSAISIFAILNMIMLFLIGTNILKLKEWAASLSALIFAFGSTSWSYAVTMYQHHATTFFILSGFYAVWQYRKNTRWSWIWGIWPWTALALAIAVDYPNAFFMLPVMVYFLISAFDVKDMKDKIKISFRLSSAFTSFLFIGIMAAHLYLNYLNYGGITKVSNSLPSYKVVKEHNIQNTATAEAQIKKIENTKNATGFFKETRMPFSPYTLTIGPDRGIFLYSPIFLLSILGIFTLFKAMDLERSVLLFSAGSIFFLYSSWGDPWGGWAFGPRYMIPAMSVLSLFAALWTSQKNYSLIRRIFALWLFAYSCFVGLLGALTTNAVPPKVEADFLKTKYNFLLNMEFLQDDRSSSYIYNTFFKATTNLTVYFFMIFVAILVIFYALAFIVPMFEKNNESDNIIK
jgi:hypothetical protein